MFSHIADMISIMFDWISSLRQSILQFAEGQYLFHRDDPVRNMHFIQSGHVFLLRRKSNGSAVILQRASAGSVLAEASLFMASYHCDAIVQSAATVAVVGRDVVQQRFLQDPAFAKTWADHLAREIRRTRRRAEILSLRTVAERLDAWLDDGVDLPAKGQWRDIAEEIGTTPEALYRELSRRRTR